MSDKDNFDFDERVGAPDGGEPATGRSKILGFVIGGVVILAAFGFIAWGGIKDNLIYFISPHELLAMENKAYGRPWRLGGQVAPGSVVWDADRNGLQFRLHDVTGPDIEVRSRTIPSAMFRDGIGVVVEGKLVNEQGRAVFHATNLMVKHSNEYKPPAEGHPSAEEMKKEMNKTLIR